jgi:hypothetical protein
MGVADEDVMLVILEVPHGAALPAGSHSGRSDLKDPSLSVRYFTTNSTSRPRWRYIKRALAPAGPSKRAPRRGGSSFLMRRFRTRPLRSRLRAIADSGRVGCDLRCVTIGGGQERASALHRD